MDMMVTDRAGVSYWDDVWFRTKRDPAGSAPLEPYTAALLKRFLGSLPKGAVVLEAGCGNSAALPYAARLGYRAVGIDYSEEGCRLLRQAEPTVEVHQADIFNPPSAILGAADAIMSFGLIEHFTEPKLAVRAMARLLRPGGQMLTIVPNMYGSIGVLQRILNRAAFDVHVRLDTSDLSRAHDDLHVSEIGRLAPVGYGVINPGHSLSSRAIVSALGRMSMVPRAIDRATPLPRTKAFSPHLYCIAVA